VSDGQTQPDRLASLREAAGRMDNALHEEGFEQHGSHAVFVRWQRASVEALGNILLEAETELGSVGRESLRADGRGVPGVFAMTSSVGRSFC
jgi:hypothetical protein